MEFKTIQSYFKAKQTLTSIQSSTLAFLSSYFSNIHTKIIQKSSKKPPKPINLSESISKLQSSEAKIDSNIRKKKLKQALQSKKELEEKLSFVSQSIGQLRQAKTPKKTQQELFDQEKKKAEDFAKEIRKFAQMRKESENTLKIQTEKIKRKVRALEEHDLVRAEKIKEQRKQIREIELEKLREKKKNREKLEQELQRSQVISPAFLEQKPLYVKIEENFKLRVEMPELEKRKEELKKKSEFFRPMQPESFKEHQKWYEELKESHLIKQQNHLKQKSFDSNLRSQSLNKSVWTHKILEEERRQEEERLQKIENKRKLLENKTRYNELLKELYKPFVNTSKHLSFDQDSDKKVKSHKKKLKGSVSVDYKHWKPHKFKVNSMAPEPKPLREPKKVLYLEEKRNMKSNSFHNLSKLEEKLDQDLNEEYLDEKKLKKVQLNANKLEEIARKKEIKLESKPISVSLIKQTASVDNLLLKSIKAKLHLLENL